MQQQLLHQQRQMFLYQQGVQANFPQPTYPMDPTAVMLLQRMLINPTMYGFSPQLMQQFQGVQPNNVFSAPNVSDSPVQGGDAGDCVARAGYSQLITNSNDPNETNGLPPLPPPE
ncbi:hypothetical protein ACHAXS_000790 [Conticribra weissflogii]